MSEFAMKITKDEKITNSAAQNQNRPARRANYTGIPIQLKERLEQSTGMPLDDVRVHYNSELPAKLDALAYTRGNQVVIAPGQERCLPHELGHVVQQKLGIVRANAMHSSGVILNTDIALERQADEIGAGKRVDILAAPTGDSIVQRKLFIRKEQETIMKEDSDMMDLDPKAVRKELRKKNSTQKAGDPTPLPEEPEQLIQFERAYGAQKIPQSVSTDPGYLEITENTMDKLFEGFIAWLGINGICLSDTKTEMFHEKIRSMVVEKTVPSAAPGTIYDQHLTGTKISRLYKGQTKEVSYYFESLGEFYLYLVLSKENRADNQNDSENPRDQKHWLKINIVNTGAGDAIVMTLPEGYLIVDLGTNLIVLLNYLGLRKNKRDNSIEDQRGIPLIGEKSCIIITHGHTDHKGNDIGQFNYRKDRLLTNLIIGCEEYFKSGGQGSPKKDLHDKIERFLRSGDFNIYDFGGGKVSDKNVDSLVIARRVEDNEAVILSGDQMPGRLISVVDDLLQQGRNEDSDHKNIVQHLMFKAPHHGSRKNNTVELMNKLNELAINIDFMVSSGRRHGHPDTRMYTDGNKLHRQGTFINFNQILYNRNKEHDAFIDTKTGRVFYTADLNINPDEIALGSIVYKSDGEKHVTYSKCYADITDTVQNSDAQKDNEALELMLAQTGISIEETVKPNPEKTASLLQEIHTLNYPYPLLMSQSEAVMLYIFPMMHENIQVNYLKLKYFNDRGNLNRFLEKLDMNKMVLRESEVWQNFFDTDDYKDFRWGKNYFYILVNTRTQGQLYLYFADILGERRQYIWENILEMAILYGMRPTKFLCLLVLGAMHEQIDPDKTDEDDLMLQDIMPHFWEKGTLRLDRLSLDPRIIFELLYNKDDEEDEETWLQERRAILKLLDIDSQIKFYSFLLASGTLSYEGVAMLLTKLDKNGNGYDILAAFDASFYLDLIHMYPECSDEICSICDNIVMCGLQAPPEGKEEDQDGTEDEYNIDWYSINKNIKDNKNYTWGSLEDLESWLEQHHINFSKFIYNILPKVLYIDIEDNGKMFLQYAYKEIEGHIEYMADLINTTYTYDKTGSYLECYLEVLVQDVINYVKIISPNLLAPQVLRKCYDISAYNSFILNALLGYPDILIRDFHMFLVHVMIHPPGDRPNIIMDWTQDVNAKVLFYSKLAYIEPEWMPTVLALHVAKANEIAKEQSPIEGQELTAAQQEIIFILNHLNNEGRSLFGEMSEEELDDIKNIMGEDGEVAIDMIIDY